MNTIILCAGLPGVGKTKVSVRVSEKLGAKVIDLDDFKKTDVDPTLVKSQIDPPELRWSYYKKALHHVFGLYEQGTTVAIMDEVFHLSSLRSQIETLCGQKGVRVLWVEVVCPYDVVKKRLQATERKGHILSTDEALKMNILFQGIFEKFPQDCDNHIVVNNDGVNDVETLVCEVLGKIEAEQMV